MVLCASRDSAAAAAPLCPFLGKECPDQSGETWEETCLATTTKALAGFKPPLLPEFNPCLLLPWPCLCCKHCALFQTLWCCTNRWQRLQLTVRALPVTAGSWRSLQSWWLGSGRMKQCAGVLWKGTAALYAADLCQESDGSSPKRSCCRWCVH